MQLRDIMSHQVQTVLPECSIKEAAQQMKSLDVGALPVCKNDSDLKMACWLSGLAFNG